MTQKSKTNGKKKKIKKQKRSNSARTPSNPRLRSSFDQYLDNFKKGFIADVIITKIPTRKNHSYKKTRFNNAEKISASKNVTDTPQKTTIQKNTVNSLRNQTTLK